MRPQQNRRMRGRGNNNRRGPNPLTRNYESNGPDVKIRGNAQHIADKYTTLARDAQASGDRVMAENYLQHAEHYLRIILSAQSQLAQPVIRDDMGDDDAEDSSPADLVESSNSQPAGSGPQPVIDGTPTEVAFAGHMSNGFDADSQEEQPKAERPRRPIRRRMPRRVTATAPASTENADADTDAADQSMTAPVESPAAPEPAEKPRRGRRTKAAKAEEVEQADA